MKFNIRPIDGHQTSVYRSLAHSSSYTCLKEEGIPGFIQREIEKEMIAEAAMERRRVLEDEVRNEMRSSSGFDRGSRQILSFSTPVIRKKEVFLLGKPNGETPLSGLKRKLTQAVPEGSSKSQGDGSKKKQATVEWSCAVCQVSVTSERGLNEHVEGKKHKVKEAALIASKTGANFGLGVSAKKTIVKPVKFALTTIDLSCSYTKMGKTSSTTGSNKYTFWCEICQVGAFSEKVMNNHKDGKKHLKTLSELPQKAKLEYGAPETEKTDNTEEKKEAETNKAAVLEIVASEEKTKTETKEDVVVETVATEEKSETETNKTMVVEVIKTVEDDKQDVTDTMVKEKRDKVKTVKAKLKNVTADDDMMETGVAEDVSM